jgi:phage-related minor tail protein
MIFQKMVFDQIAGAISGGLGSIVGGKALGGAVHAGSAYKVGESGPEVFVPRVPGSIVPRSKMGGGGVTINSTVNAAPGTNRAELQAMLNQRDAELIRKIPRVMVDRQRRNALSGAF